MPSVIYDHLGIPRKLTHLRAVQHLEALKAKHGTNPWPVIEACFAVWEETNPTQWRSHLVYLDEVRRTRKDRKFASTKDKQHGGYLRYTLDIPEKVVKMIRTLYTPDELPMNRRFFASFAKKFPKCKVAEKL